MLLVYSTGPSAHASDVVVARTRATTKAINILFFITFSPYALGDSLPFTGGYPF